MRESHGQKAFNPETIDSVHLYTIQMEIQTGMEAEEAKPDVWAYNKAADEWKGFFVEIAERGTLRFAPDPADPHRFEFNGSAFQFNDDCQGRGKKIPVGRRKREPLGVGFFLGFVLFFPVGFWV